MHTNQPTDGVSVRTSARVGFWLGLALFAALLLIPPLKSVRDVAREHFADELPRDVAAILAAEGNHDAAPGSKAYEAALERAVTARARMTMSAAAVTALTAVWWMTVAIPIPVTSLLPLVLFPLVGVLSVSQTAVPYADKNVFLFMGGFIVALGVERWGLHRRIALQTVRIIGTGRATIVLGFMCASAILSMWISNTATTMMMLPIGMAVVASLAEMNGDSDDPRRANFAAALMLGIAYAASVGGIATPIGTPPNIVFHGQLSKSFPNAPEISFGHWMLLQLPLVIVFLPLIWLVLVRVTCRFEAGGFRAGREIVREQLRKLGRMGRPEKIMLAVFAATALLWMTRSIPTGPTDADNYGWAWLLERCFSGDDPGVHRFRAEYIHDATIALAMAALMFMIPAGRDEQSRRSYLMNWETAQRLPWGILLLFGGGFAIAAGFRASGLSLWCGKVFVGLGISNPLVLVLATCLLMTFLTEITSNTATTQVMLPILANVSVQMGINPLLLMLPATVSASCAFMLPVATPPNAIVFGSGQIEMGRMVRTGIILNLIGAVLVTLLIYLVARPMLGIALDTWPAWAG